MAGIVIRPLNTVYWFIPKNACTSLKAHYARLLKLPFRSPHRARFEYTDVILPGFFNYAIVRHPFQRLYSCWANKIADGHPVSPDFVNGIDIHVFKGMMHQGYSEMPFEDFALLVMGAKVKDDPHWAPQSSQVPNGIHFFKLEEQPLLKALLHTSNADHTGGRWQDHFTPRVLNRALEYYAEDFRRYGY